MCHVHAMEDFEFDVIRVRKEGRMRTGCDPLCFACITLGWVGGVMADLQLRPTKVKASRRPAAAADGKSGSSAGTVSAAAAEKAAELKTIKRAAQRKSARAAKKRKIGKDAEERELEAVLFGSDPNVMTAGMGHELDDTPTPAAAGAGAGGGKQQKPNKKQKPNSAAAPKAVKTEPAAGGAVSDDSLFQIDKTGRAAPAARAKSAAANGGGGGGGGGGGAVAAWVDADDEAETVDIAEDAASTRLRKLRTSYDESKLSGTEYTERLRHK